MDKDLIITYIMTCPAEEAKERAEEVALEQSVELPRDAVKDREVAKISIPDILELTPLCMLSNGLTQHRLGLSFSSSIVGKDIPQFFNILFGNISLKEGLRIEDMRLPEEVLHLFPGPAHGIEGIREASHCPSGSLLCSVLKPVGSSSDMLARMAGAFAKAGVPFIKDDHGISDQSTSPFAERVKKVQAEIKGMGAKSIYLPNITGPVEGLEEKIAIAFNEGIQGFLVSPFLIGLDQFRYLRERFPVFWMAHPALSGAFFADKSHGFRPGLLLGTIFRLLGADMVIYPDAGGRFPFTADECRDIANGLREGYQGRFKPAMPVPAGGISLSRATQVRHFYGDDVMLLIGGSIYLHEEGLEKTARELVNILSRPIPKQPPGPAKEQEGPPSGLKGSAQPLPSYKKNIIRHQKPGIWEGVKRCPYKMEGAHFKGMTRTEMYVPECEEAGFDVRYFEIEPGGFSSLEKHMHIHFVIAVRGKGEVRIADKWHSLSPNDMVLIPSNCPHQLRNQGSDVFGFYCIVDHLRDQPIPLGDE